MEIIQQIFVLKHAHLDHSRITRQENVLKNVQKMKEYMVIHFFMFAPTHVQEGYLEVN